jgi:hypothetical protein
MSQDSAGLLRDKNIEQQRRSVEKTAGEKQRLVVFDYTGVNPAVKVLVGIELATEIPPDWVHVLSRAARSRGRMESHVAQVMTAAFTSTGFMVPMRCSHSRLVHAVKKPSETATERDAGGQDAALEEMDSMEPEIIHSF